MQKAFLRSIENTVAHGDTDIFPFPIENIIFFDMKDKVVDLLAELHSDFSKSIGNSPPSNYEALAPVGYTGFRWATQIDPLWNAYFLALVLEIAPKIEAARIPREHNAVFSYRLNIENKGPDLFSREYGWKSFTERAITLAKSHTFVVSCDISEFYPRLNHHRLDNALRQLHQADDARLKIMSFLSNFSGTYSFGLPVGGPASRILSELTLNQIDRLISQKRIPFCRFADDFYLFANSEDEAFKNLVYLSEILHRNQGLQLQKSKTRIMSSAEFIRTNPLNLELDQEGEQGDLARAAQSLMQLSLHFDPYSATAQLDYEILKSHIEAFPILEIIKSEISKSKVNISLARKIIGTLEFIDVGQVDDAARTLIENENILYPVYFNVLAALKKCFQKISGPIQDHICSYVRNLIEANSSVMAIDLNIQYAVRLLALKRSEESVSTLAMLYDQTNSPAIRRDIVLAMARWKEWTWISDRRAFFRSMGPSERRAYIVASYILKDEGSHWRKHIHDEFQPLERLVQEWVSSRVNIDKWEIPL